jgi:hypothetical protein
MLNSIKKIINQNEDKINSKRGLHQFLNIFSLLFSFLLCSVQFGNGPGSNGNVEQWINLTSQLFYGDNDLLFSYGPLFWLTGGASTPYSVTTYLASLIFVSLYFALFWAVIIHISIQRRVILWVALTFLVFIKSLVFAPAFFMWAFVLVVYIEHVKINKISLVSWFVVGCICSLFLYVRFFWGIAAIATFCLYIISRGLDSHNLRSLVTIAVGFIFGCVGFGLIIFHEPLNLISYFKINNQLSYGNSVDMVLDVDVNGSMWIAVFIIVISINLYLISCRRNLLLMVNFLLLISFKLGFGRADHYLWFAGPVSIMMLILFWSESKISRLAYCACFLGLCVLLFLPTYKGASVVKIINVPVSFKVSYFDRMQDIYKEYRLASDFLKIIGGASVDVYPYNNEYVFANKLNYRHRPSFQNYMTLTPSLDMMNKKFLESKDGPEFIIWTAGIACGSSDCNPFDSFDGKYSLNEDPLTVDAILRNYKKVALTHGLRGVPVILLQKNEIPIESFVKILGRGSFKFGEWIDVPYFGGEFIRIQPNFKLGTLAKIKNIFFRGNILKIKYLFESGEIKEYRINIINAGSGVLAAPFIRDFKFSNSRPVKVMFEAKGEGYFEDSFDASWVSIGINGIDK